MANDINGISGSHVNPSLEQAQSQATRREPERTQSQANPAQPANQTDSVQLTETAAILQRAQSRLSTVPVVDTQKVESVKSAIDSGQYSVDSARVADKMVQLEGLLSGKNQS